jgi:hypothetical protein
MLSHRPTILAIATHVSLAGLLYGLDTGEFLAKHMISAMKME